MKNLLIIILLSLITVFSYKFYLDSKENLKETYNYAKKMHTLATEIKTLKNLYKPYIPPFCKKIQKNTSVEIICNNMNKTKFFYFQNTLKKSFLIKFNIQKENLINATAEIKK